MSTTVTTLDIGSSNIKATIAELNNGYKPTIIGSVIGESRGIKNGEIVNMQETSEALKEVTENLKKKTNYDFRECLLTITGTHIKGIDTNGLISTSRKNNAGVEEPGIITSAHIEKVNQKVEENSMACPLPVDREILHIFPKEYIVDNRRGIISPKDLTGRRLEIKAHLTIYSTTAARNLTRCLKKAGIKVKKIVLHSLASSYSTLSEDEKEHGTILIDLGADTTNIIYYRQGQVHFTGFVPQGGENVTRDIARMLQISSKNAEKLKIEHGYALQDLVQNNKILEIKGLSGHASKEIRKKELAEYIEARMREIFQEAKVQTGKINTPLVNNPPVVLTGGGSLINGCEKLCGEIFHSSCRIAKPVNLQGNLDNISSPLFSAATGLIHYANKNSSESKAKELLQKTPVDLSFLEKIKNFIDRIM
ncbi:MAG: cell division protein FtsA [Candidatus Marinimicrobia bacterium]|nr:cell division protein FtsA [Candidatus Neomarinimicrobiota bacterium]